MKRARRLLVVFVLGSLTMAPALIGAAIWGTSPAIMCGVASGILFDVIVTAGMNRAHD